MNVTESRKERDHGTWESGSLAQGFYARDIMKRDSHPLGSLGTFGVRMDSESSLNSQKRVSA